MRGLWKGGLILWMKESLLVGGENILKFRNVLWNLRVVWWNWSRILRIWK